MTRTTKYMAQAITVAVVVLAFSLSAFVQSDIRSNGQLLVVPPGAGQETGDGNEWKIIGEQSGGRFISSASSQQVPDRRQNIDFSTLEKVALEELREKNTPGAAVAIVSGDRIIYAKGLGVSNIETVAPVTPDLLFRIASTTKMFTAALLVSLAEEGRLNLNEPIGKYVKGLSPKLSRITSHQLLSHTAGLIDAGGRYLDRRKSRPWPARCVPGQMTSFSLNRISSYPTPMLVSSSLVLSPKRLAASLTLI